MTENKKITPRKLSGFMELAPAKQVIFNNMVDSTRQVFENNCFLPLDTPVLELSEILLAKSGGEIDKEVYHFKKGDTDICMRYDLTVPLARFVAMHSEELNYPFKRYQIGKVYRGEKAQKGRFREFYQCDADIIGNGELSLVADAECVNLLYEIFKALNLKVTINISNRNILFGLIESLGLSDKAFDILTVLDKLGKIEEKNALSCLKNLGLDDASGNTLIEFAGISGKIEDVIMRIENFSSNSTFAMGVNQLKELGTYLKAMNTENYILNLGIIRGQNYYTGTIFEVYLDEHPEFGAVGAGGRYDNLAGYFTDKKLPGVGMSIGLTRLFDQLDNANLLGETPLTTATVSIIPLGDTLSHCITLASFLKANGVKAEVSYEDRSFKAKLKDANRKEVPYVIIVGEDEVATGKYTLKDMKESTQTLLSKEDCVKYIKSN